MYKRESVLMIEIKPFWFVNEASALTLGLITKAQLDKLKSKSSVCEQHD